MKMIYLKLIFILFLATPISLAASERPDLVSSNQLFECADMVALITITKGELNDTSYKIEGNVKKEFKGRSNQVDVKLNFSESILFDSPIKLGSTYLVHLKNYGDNSFVPVQAYGAIMEVKALDKERPDIQFSLKKLKLEKTDYVVYGNEIWYPEVCSVYDNIKLCASYVDILGKA